MINRTLRATVRCAALAVLLCCFSATHAQDETYYGGNLDDVVISDERAQDLARQLLDVDALLHALSAKAIANDDRLVDFVEGFMERNGIGVLTISYVDSDDLWPKILKKGSLKKIQKAPDATLVAGILFFPEESLDGETRNYTARLVLEGKTNEVYDLLNVSGEDMVLISEETSDEQIGNQSFSKPKEAQDKVVNAMIAALQKVEQIADEGPIGQVVTFRKKGNQKHGFDLQTYDQLQSDYPIIVVGGESHPTAWKSLKATQPDEVIAIDTSGQEVAFELDGISVNGALTDGKYTLSLQGTSDGTEGELLAKVGETMVGKLNTVSYSLSSIDLKIVPVNGAGSDISQAALQRELDSIYAPAVASWNVQVLDNQQLGNAWDPEGNGLDDGETGSFTNYTDEMNDLIKEFKRQNDRDKDAYYIFLVNKTENPSKLGYMPRKKQWGFVFTNGQSTEVLTKTIAHELGHGVYRLEHPFSEKGLPKGQTDNLMDYSNGKELYKYQWDYVHDPASVITLFDDEEEAAMTAKTLFIDYLGHKDVFVHDDMFTGDEVVLVSPAGKPIQLPQTIIPSFTGPVKDKEGTIYDLGFPRGVLLAFKEGSNTYISNFSEVDGEYIFNGYKLYGSDPTVFKETSAPARNESMVVLGAEDEYCFLGIYSGYYSHDDLSNNENPYKAAGPVKTSSFTLRDQENQGWIRIDEGCSRDIELATLKPSYQDILKNGFVVVNPSDPNGVMLTYTMEVDGYEAGNATGYIYRTLDDLGNEIYFKWTEQQVWERFELSEDNQLDIPPNLLTLAEIWEAIKNDPIHSTLNLAGFIPVIGMGADGLNAVIYYVEGDKIAALLSSVAIVSSGIVVGAKFAVRLAKQTKKVQGFYRLTDDFVARMDNVLLSASDRLIVNQEEWITLQSNLFELGEKYGDDGMKALTELSTNMDPVSFLNTADVINKLDNGTDLFSDLNKADFASYIKEAGPDGVTGWQSFKKIDLDELATDKNSLINYNKALKQDGYDSDYFEALLTSKENPKDFLDDYVSKLGNDGKFTDTKLESDYQSYVSRKAKEGKMPRDRSDWNQVRDYWLNDSPMARGNDFNKKAVREAWYDADEVHLANGKRLDSYNFDPLEIISRKATDLGDIQLSTFEKYLDEMIGKYSPGTKIRSDKYPDLDGEFLEGDMILEIPKTNETLVNIQDYIDLAKSKGITLRFSPE